MEGLIYVFMLSVVFVVAPFVFIIPAIGIMISIIDWLEEMGEIQ